MDLLVDSTGRDPALGPGAGAGPAVEPSVVVLLTSVVLIQRKPRG